MSNEIEMYVQDKEGTKNEIHFIINNVICWGKRCSLNTKEQLLTAGFEIHMPEDIDEGVIIPELTELEEEKKESEEDNEEIIIPESTELEDGNKTDTDSNSAPLEGIGNEPVLNEGDEEKIEPQTVGFVQTQEDIGEVDPKFQYQKTKRKKNLIVKFQVEMVK